jgi:hypothetical protein
MGRATVGVCVLVACGARTDLGTRTVSDASAPIDAHVVDTGIDASSVCPPITYASDDGSSTVLALDDASVYFMMSTCTVGRMAKGGGLMQTWGLGDDCAGEIVVDATHLYWTNAAGHLERVPTTGSFTIEDLGCAALAGCPGNVHVRAIAKDVVVLVDGFRPIAMAKKASTPYALAPANIAPPAPVHYVFTDDFRAYWNTDIRVFSNALDGSDPPFQYATSSSGLAIDASHVYWTAHVGPTTWDLLSATKNAPGQTTLSTGDTSTPLVANDAFVYGVSDAGITRQPTSGGAADVIVPGAHPLAILIDDACVYWAEKTTNGRRIARAPR